MPKIDEKIQHEMDCYGVDTIEELNDIWEADSISQEQEDLDEIVSEIESGIRPNKKDIAWLLRNRKRAHIPQVMREYIAKLLLGENLGGNQRRSRISTKDRGLMEYSSDEEVDFRITIERDFGCKPEYDSLLSVGLKKESSREDEIGALDLIAKTRLLGIMPDFDRVNFIKDKTEKIDYVKKIIDSVKKAWDEVDIETADQLDREIRSISRIIHLRKK